jgi:hypothetical protein
VKFLMAWELGGGLGHIVKLNLLGNQLESRGHTVYYALRQPKAAEVLGFCADNDVFPAPAMSVFEHSQRAAYDYADLLLRRGYENQKRLDGRIEGWMKIFDRVQPDQLIADHAPCARLSAYIAGIKSHIIGTGFTVPPQTNPLQPFAQTRAPDITLQQNLEERLNLTINGTLNRWRKPEVERAIEIFIGGSRHVCTIEELDSYSNRLEETFYGPMMGVSKGDKPNWPEKQAKRIFIYLRKDAASLPIVLSGLRGMDVQVLAYLGGSSERNFTNTENSNIVISENPVDLSQLRHTCDLVICHGGNNTLATALLQGLPVLALPQHVEQRMACTRLQDQGLGRVLRGNFDEKKFVSTANFLINDKALRRRTMALAERYADKNPEHAAAAIASIIDQ